MPPTNNSPVPAPAPSISDLEAALATAGKIAQQLVGDKYNAASQFVAGLRANIDHANELLDMHQAWMAANPPKAPVAAPVAAPAAPAPAPAPQSTPAAK
jgi:hypothetical protein